MCCSKLWILQGCERQSRILGPAFWFGVIQRVWVLVLPFTSRMTLDKVMFPLWASAFSCTKGGYYLLTGLLWGQMKCWIWKHFVKFHRDLSHFYYYYYYHKRTKDWPGLQKQLPKYFKYCRCHRVPQVFLVTSIIPFNHWAWTLYPAGTTS